MWRPRLIEYIWFGCIPVVLADDYYLPFSALVDWDDFSVRICEKDAHRIKEILVSLPPERIDTLRRNLGKVGVRSCPPSPHR